MLYSFSAFEQRTPIPTGDVEDEIAAALVKYGPLAIGINANMMQMYMGGIAEPDAEACDPEELNHGVTLVGFGEDSVTVHDPKAVKQLMVNHLDLQSRGILQLKSGESVKDNIWGMVKKQDGEVKKWWKIRNSWGAEWGEEVTLFVSS